MSKNLCSVIIVASSLSLSAPAYAKKPDGCDLKINQNGEPKINGYDALSGGDYVEDIRIKLKNEGDERCSGVLTIRRSALFDRLRGPQSGNFLDYLIVAQDNASQVLLDPLTQQTQGIPVSLTPSESIELRPRLFVRGGQAGRQGRYFADMLAIVSLGNGGDTVDRDFTVSAQVQARAQANFVGGRNATLDLGELAPNVTGSINMQVRSTADIDVSVSSENEGNLVRGHGEFEIPYTMTVDGRLIDLENGSRFNMPLQNSIRGQSLPVVVTVGEFSNAPVGNYGDVVTFRISAR